MILDSHDTARVRTVAGSRERQLVGMGLRRPRPACRWSSRATRSGSTGEWGEDARAPIPWDRPETWDGELLAAYRRLIVLRRSVAGARDGRPALARTRAPTPSLYLRETQR